MGSPAKRMRIHQADEKSVIYAKEKQKNQQKLKSRFESIFEKFGNMNESQSDEIDMKTNRVVVDRGHLRRIERRVGGEGRALLDTIVLTSVKELEDDEEEEEEDSEDELTLPRVSKPKTTRPPEQNPQLAISATLMPRRISPQTSSIQLPQTPAGTEAQSAAFCANLLRTIQQTIHQYTAGLTTRDAPRAFSNAAPVPIIPMTTNDKVTPASDPKWFFPPLPAIQRQFLVPQSCPLPHHTIVETAEEAAREHKGIISIEMDEERPVMAPNARPDDESSSTRPQRSNTHSTCKWGRPIIYKFNHKDDVYISRCRRIDGMRWKDIKNKKKEWKNWPIHAFHRHWRLIKGQSLHLQETTVTPTDNSGGIASRKRVHPHPKKRGMRGNVKRTEKDVSDDGWSADELAI